MSRDRGCRGEGRDERRGEKWKGGEGEKEATG